MVLNTEYSYAYTSMRFSARQGVAVVLLWDGMGWDNAVRCRLGPVCFAAACLTRTDQRGGIGGALFSCPLLVLQIPSTAVAV